jgi:hypothetical protein
MMTPWSNHEESNSRITVRKDGVLAFTLDRERIGDHLGNWEVRRPDSDEVIFKDKYRNDIFCGIESGRIK